MVNKMSENVFKTKSYTDYVSKRLSGPLRRGDKLRLAVALRVEPSFVSRVLKGVAHFSLEHAVVINEFLGHSPDESQYFLLLLQYERAGTKKLRDVFKAQMDAILEKRAEVSERIGVRQKIPLEIQTTYFSSWIYAAVLSVTMVRTYRTPVRIAERLQVDLKLVHQVVAFLKTEGFLEERSGELIPTQQRIHLKRGEPLLLQHHTQWRLRAMEAFLRKDGLHYSAVFSMSASDRDWFKDRCLELLTELEARLKNSPDEEIVGINLDVFSV